MEQNCCLLKIKISNGAKDCCTFYKILLGQPKHIHFTFLYNWKQKNIPNCVFFHANCFDDDFFCLWLQKKWTKTVWAKNNKYVIWLILQIFYYWLCLNFSYDAMSCKQFLSDNCKINSNRNIMGPQIFIQKANEMGHSVDVLFDNWY